MFGIMATKRKCMTLEERVKCLKLLEQGKSSRVVATEMGVGRSTYHFVFSSPVT